MNKKYLILVFLIASVIGLIIFVTKKDSTISKENPIQGSAHLIYTNNEFGFSFEYPDYYKIEEKTLDTANRYHKEIILLPKDFVPPEGGEGPTTINIDIYQNNLDKQSPESWVKGTAVSNYKLGDGLLTTVKVGNIDGLAYDWDGLYRGHTTAFEFNENIYAIAGTYLELTDIIRKDYENILKSFKFGPSALVVDFLKKNISSISPEKEVLGGKFYITEIKFINENSGIVSYEDGHIALVADFTFNISEAGAVSIDSFRIRK